MVTVHRINVWLAYQGIIVANNVFGALNTCMKFVVHRNCSGVDGSQPYRILVLNAHIIRTLAAWGQHVKMYIKAAV